MLWPLLLLIAGLIAIVVGLVAAFGGGFMSSRSPLQDALVWLFPLGALATVAAVVWLVILQIMVWLS